MPEIGPTDRPEDSADLLRAARAGDREAFGSLTERYRRYLKNIATRVLGRERADDCSDIVQQGLAKAFEEFQKDKFLGQSPGEFVAWLAAIVRHKACDELGRRRPQGLPVNASDDCIQDNLIVSLSTPSKLVSAREEAARMLEALARLPEEYREVLELCYLQNWSDDAIAERLQKNRPNIRKIRQRGLEKLRAELSHGDG